MKDDSKYIYIITSDCEDQHYNALYIHHEFPSFNTKLEAQEFLDSLGKFVIEDDFQMEKIALPCLAIEAEKIAYNWIKARYKE